MDSKLKYVHTTDVHNQSAPNKVVPILIELFQPKSVLDVGCGIGTWLKSFADSGVKDIMGLDGDFVDRDMLSSFIALENYQATDLSNSFELGRKYDLVISLEVAEHLPASSAKGFIESLVKHGDVIVFSAAIPGQGGQNHLNEQWKKYWIDIFSEHGYHVYDIIRPRIWNISEINWWYKQNAVVFSNRDLSHLVPLCSGYTDAIHPELFIQNQDYIIYLQGYVAGLEQKIYELQYPKS